MVLWTTIYNRHVSEISGQTDRPETDSMLRHSSQQEYDHQLGICSQ